MTPFANTACVRCGKEYREILRYRRVHKITLTCRDGHGPMYEASHHQWIDKPKRRPVAGPTTRIRS